MQRSNLQVMVRPRRLPSDGQRGSIKLDVYGNEIEMTNNMFQYDVVFAEDASQEQVYERLQSAVEKLVEGYCVGILAYGQTSSGKTYTIGTNAVEECYIENPGIISRAASDIFRLAVPRGETTQINVKVTFMEIYNEQAFDLLHIDDKRKPLIKKVRDIPRKDRPGELVTEVEGLTTEQVESTQGVMDVLQRGSRNRRVASTTMNANSSRSHAVFTIFVEHLNDEGESTLATTPYLQLVDLAGSEVPEGDKTTMKEGVNINKSLSALGRVIIQLRDRNGHVSYRDSVLTRVLKPLLDGNSITTLIACVSMESCNEAESKKTLQYAQQARKIEISAQKAQRAITREEFLKLKDENRRLKKLCANHNLELGDLEMTMIALEEEKDKEPFGAAVRTEEMIQMLLKYEASTKRAEMLQERCNQLEQLVELRPKKLDRSETAARMTAAGEGVLNATFDVDKSGNDVEDEDPAEEEEMEESRNEIELVSALSVLDRDYDEHSNQLKYFVEMQKKSAQLQDKVADLEKQLVLAEAEKASVAKQMSSSKKGSPELKELQTKLDAQAEKNRVLQEKLAQLRKELKSSQVNSDTIEKYKAKIDTINRERVKLQRMLKEQSKKSQDEIKRQKREMIALQRQQQRAAAEQNKRDAKQAAERRCQQRKLEQALAAKDRLETLLKRKNENSKDAAKQLSAAKGKLDTSQVFNRIKEIVDEEINMAATRAMTAFYVDDYSKQIQAFSSRLVEIEAQLSEADVTPEVRADLEEELADLVDKRKNAQQVLDKNQSVQKSAESSAKLHDRFGTAPYDAQLAIKILVQRIEKFAYEVAASRDELSSVKEQLAHTKQLLADCEHEKQLVEDKYNGIMLESFRDEGELSKLEHELKERDAEISSLKAKLESLAHDELIPRSPFAKSLHFRKNVPLGRSVALRRIGQSNLDAVMDSSTLFTEDEKSFTDNKESDPDWVATQSRRTVSNGNKANVSGNSNSSTGRGRKLFRENSNDEDGNMADVENEGPPLKREKSDGSLLGCRCSGGKSCQKCKCTKSGATCTANCKCGAKCSNAPVESDDDTAQRIPATVMNLMETVENNKLY